MTTMTSPRHARIGCITLTANNKCCGLWEINGLGQYRELGQTEQALMEMIQVGSKPVFGYAPEPDGSYPIIGHSFPTNYSHFIFTGASSCNMEVAYAHAFAELIHNLGLGTVTTCPTRKNGNSTNYVTPYIWAVDTKKLLDYAEPILVEWTKHVLARDQREKEMRALVPPAARNNQDLYNARAASQSGPR